MRQYADSSGRTNGIWTASANGSHLRQLVPKGFTPLWSPDGGTIAYWLSNALRLVRPQGGSGKTLVPRSVDWIFGWSPDAKQIAFQRQGGWLEVVDVATGKVQKLLRLHFVPNVVWSSTSQELLVKTQPLRQSRCASLWRVPADGSKPQLLRRC